MKRAVAARKTALITGANSGIGAATARELAARGFHCVLACRSLEATRPVLADIQAAGGSGEFLALDLGDLDSVNAAADAFSAAGEPLHVLVNNAGVAGARGMTASGFEAAFGVNHLGHFLFTNRLLESIKRAAPSRIVTVASRSHYSARSVDEEAVRKPTASWTGLPEYAVSKLANVLFSAELARRLEGSGVSTYALHPGVVATEIWRSVPRPFRSVIKVAMISPQTGARTTLHCATSEAAGTQSGLYYDGCKPVTPSKPARDTDLAKILWRNSERWAGL